MPFVGLRRLSAVVRRVLVSTLTLAEKSQMKSLRSVACSRIAVLSFSKVAALVVGSLLSVDAFAIDFNISAPELIYSKNQRKSAGGANWPDGNFGVISNGNGTYDFYAANSTTPVMTTGTLNNPGATKQKISITGIPKKTFSYVAGGPVYEDPYSGARLMIYHAEDGGKGKEFYSMLGMAISTDGREFRDLGVVIKPNLPAGNAEVGGGSFAIVNGYMNIYYKDWLADGSTAEVAVARASMTDIMNNALMGRNTSFNKYYNGGWTHSALGGKASYLENVNPANSWLSVSYNDHINQLVMVSSQWSGDGGDLYYATSPDGVQWSSRKPLAVDAGEQFYPSIVGTGSDPSRTGQSFYVYYTDSQKGVWDRWSDAELRRRTVTISAPASGTSTGDPRGYTANWTTVGDYQSDFQGGTPAAGWKYAWNSKGKAGKSAGYTSLVWSESAQAYNTTGGATMAPNPKTHNDDFVSLSADGGHPGMSKYTAIAGYTIQNDDGAGLYRLTDSSIQKSNGALATKEDGLQVMVYVNDTLIGAAQNVLTSGALANFDRMLGALNIGDTVWVAIDSLKNQTDDGFRSFDFSLQRLVYSNISSPGQLTAFSAMSLETTSIPEPSSLALLFMGMVGCCVRRRRR